MTVSTAVRPAADEHIPYFGKYIALVPESDALAALQHQLDDMLPLLRGLSEAQGALRYAPGKWSIKQVLGHMIDGERVFAYRALRFARADQTELPGFDENPYAEMAGSDDRSLASLIKELEMLRRANIEMYAGFPAEAWSRRGKASGNPVTVRALAFIIAGHGWHHMGILQERYLGAK